MVVVAVDGSDGSEVAVELAQRLPSVSKGFFVFVLPSSQHSFLSDPLHDNVDRIESYMLEKKADEVAARLSSRFPKWSFEKVRSDEDAGACLLKVCREKNASLLVMGRSRSAVDHLLLGSTSLYCVRNSDQCPVLLAKKPSV